MLHANCTKINYDCRSVFLTSICSYNCGTMRTKCLRELHFEDAFWAAALKDCPPGMVNGSFSFCYNFETSALDQMNACIPRVRPTTHFVAFKINNDNVVVTDVKDPKQVKVPKTVSVDTESCPKGVEQGKGACVMKTTIQVPYTDETLVSTCPSGFTEEKGGCVKESKVYAPAEEVPAATKGSKKGEASPVTIACPASTQKNSVGLCYKTNFETAAPKVVTAVKVAFKTETVTESVPAMVSYTTKTEYETATVQDFDN